jgi:hypothetical protein
MRLTGHRRGNSTVRFMIEQAARRRMYHAVSPERDAGDAAPGGTVLRWSREFFEQLHAALLPRMAYVADTPEGQLRYFGSRALSVWACVSEHATALAYEHAESPLQIRERARRWFACLTTRTAPGLASPHWGHPVYGARLDPLSGELDVVWAVPGDWCDAVLSGAVPQREWDAPPSWRPPLAGTLGQPAS